MNPRRLTRATALGLALATLAASTAAAQQDLRSPDARDAAQAAQTRQDPPRQDLRSPDARDAAAGRGTFSAPEVTIIRVTHPSARSGGLNWRDAGIGAGAMLGLILLALGSVLAVVHRGNRATRNQPAPTS